MREGDTPLIDAARHGRAADVVALLADGADVNERNQKGANSLYVACHEGHTEVVKKLLAANADVGQAYVSWTPLLVVCMKVNLLNRVWWNFLFLKFLTLI